MGAEDSLTQLRKKINRKTKREKSSEIRKPQLSEIEGNNSKSKVKKKNKISPDDTAIKVDSKVVGLPNIRDETREKNGETQKSRKLRENKRKNGEITKTGVDEFDTPDSNKVEVRTAGKKDAENEAGEDKLQKSRKKKRKNIETVTKSDELKEEVDSPEQEKDEGVALGTQSEPEDHVTSSKVLNETSKRSSKSGKKKKSAKMKKKTQLVANESSQSNLLEKKGEAEEDEVYQMSSGDEDESKGMKKWITQYHQSRPGVHVLQERIDDFISAHEEQEEQARKEREAQAAEGGWTVVVQHKGRKKTADAESGTVVGSVAQAAVLDKMAKKKNKEVGIDFYRFQKREAHRNEIMMLQSKFEQDKQRIQQMRAARKFRPY